MSLSIIIPVKDEEEIITNTLFELDKSWLKNIEHEILIINDNSIDGTKKLIENIETKNIKIIYKDNIICPFT